MSENENMFISNNKESIKNEYTQAKIRMLILKDMLKKYSIDDLNTSCYALLNDEYRLIYLYIKQLEERAKEEGIEL